MAGNNNETFQYISIPQFFSGKNIFITGATGFVGKFLIEKLLRSCPEIGNIYIMVRPKKECKPNERLQSILKSNLFDTIKEKRPNDLNKIKVIFGDLLMDNLGISNEDWEILIQNVSIVFHAAAFVRFDATLKKVIEANVTGMRKIIKLCHEIRQLKALVYTSTAFSNFERLEIDEKVYNQQYNAVDIEAMCKWMPDEMFNKITLDLLNKKPNTYIFSKSLAEQIIQNEAHQLPVAIVRPSIMGACYKEPIPGFIENFTGLTFCLYGVGNGLVRMFPFKGDETADIVPSDITINTIIAAAWQTGKQKSSDPKLTVYNSVNQTPITWYNFQRISVHYMRKNPFEGFNWYTFSFGCKSDRIYKWISYFLYTIPAVIIDFFLKCLCKKPIMMKTHKRFEKAIQSLKYFMRSTWKFNDTNVRNLIFEMNREDLANFQTNATELNWDEYMENYCLGIRKYLLKQDDNSLEKCRQQMTRSFYYHYILIIFIVVIFVTFIISL